MENSTYITRFKSEFALKYTVNAEEPLGAGAYATVYKGRDIDRNIDVAIKIYHDGIAREGSSRDWIISSVTHHHQIAHTYTIENFRAGDKDCKAVISRFVPGKSLQSVWDTLGTLEAEDLELVEDDYAHSLIPSLLDILSYCHLLGYGHGDLRQGNIMVNLDSKSEIRLESVAYLIDFDNASVKDTLSDMTDEQKIESDYRSLTHIIGGTIGDWQHADSVRDLLDGYQTVLLLRTAYYKMLEFVKISKKSVFTMNSILIFLKSLIPLEITRADYDPIIRATKRIAILKGKSEEFSDALVHFNKYYQDYEDLAEMDYTIEVIDNYEARNKIYQKIYDQ